MATLLNRRRYMGGGSALPYDAEIEYLETTGTTGFFIGSGITTNSNTSSIEMQMKAQFLSTTARQIFGAEDKFYMGVNNGAWETDYRAFYGTADTDVHTFAKRGVKSATRIYVYIDEVQVYNYNANIYGNYIRYQLGIFNYKKGQILGLHCKFYWEKIYKDDVLVRDYVPVRVGNVGYLYDKVSQTLYANEDTGTFILGPDKN